MAEQNPTDGQAQAVAFGLTKGLIDKYPELQRVWELFLAGNITDAKLAYYETDYYKNLGTAAKNRTVMKTTQPGVYQQELEKFVLGEKKRLIAKGIKLDDAAKVAEMAYNEALDKVKEIYKSESDIVETIKDLKL